MSYDSTNQRVYVDTNTDPHTGITFDDVNDAFGGTTIGDVGTLCTSDRINHFSAVKPVRSDELLVTDFAGLNYGFDCDAEQLTGVIDDISRAPSNAESSPDWSDHYLKPRGFEGGEGGSNEWYRMLDFNGYRHGSVSPVSSSFNQSTGAYTLTMDANVNMMQVHLMDAIENWESMGDKDDLRYVLVSIGNGTQYIIGDALFSNNTFNGSASFTMTNIVPERTYKLCVVIAPCVEENSRWILAGGSSEFPQSSEGDTPAMYLPSSYYTFMRPGPHSGISISNLVVWGEGDGVIETIHWTYTIENGSGYSISLSLNNILINAGDIIYDSVPGPGGHPSQEGYTVATDGDSLEGDSGAGRTIASGSSLNVSGETNFSGDGESGMVVVDLTLRYTTEYDGSHNEHDISLCGNDGEWSEYHDQPDFEEKVFLND